MSVPEPGLVHSSIHGPNPDNPSALAVIQTHPIQYHAPLYRTLQSRFHIQVTAIYGSDFSLVGYRDREFGTTFAWDTDLLSGYTSVFLSSVSQAGSRSADNVSTAGIYNILKKIAPQAVLLTGYSPRFYQEALWQTWWSGHPILFRGETTDSAHRRSSLKHMVRDALLRRFYRQCAGLLFVGKASRQHFVRLGCPDSKLVFSPYCVDVASFQPNEEHRVELRDVTRESLNISSGKITILFSGKLVPRKAPNRILQAVKSLSDAIRNQIVIVFLGSGELLEELAASAQSDPKVEVRFVGFQNQTVLSRFYHAADLLVLPSVRSETWGLVVNEALHHGLPCVVSDRVGCAMDLIENAGTGEIFAAESSTELAAAITRAMNLVGRSDVRVKCRSWVANYTVEKAAEGIAQSFRQLAARCQPAL